MDLLRPWWPGIVLLLLSVTVGLFCYADYGMSWDEPAQRGLGMVTYDYVINGDPALQTYVDRALGTGFEWPLYALEQALHLEDPRDIYLARHLATHLFFLVAVFCGYILAWRLFRDQFLACLAFVVIAFHPRLYAHSFFNSKDIPFLSAILIALLTSHVAFESGSRAWCLLLGMASGYATSIRLWGMLFIPVFGVFFVIDVFRDRRSAVRLRAHITHAILYALGFSGILYAAWPLLWGNPFFHLTESFRSLAHVAWGGIVLFNGVSYRGDALPWDYTPVWYWITVPELWLLAGIAGSTWVLVACIRRPLDYLTHVPGRHYVLYLACCLGPVMGMIVFRGVNIDDWRHLYFTYPPFVMLALMCIHKLAQGLRRRMFLAVCALQLAATGYFMVYAHPYQQVYFNRFVSHGDEYLRTHYDLEYWGTAYKAGLEYILAHDASEKIAVRSTFKVPVENNIMLLPKASRQRLAVVGEDEPADYFITNFRMHPGEFGYSEIYYEVRVLNSTIMRVYKLREGPDGGIANAG